MHDRITVNIGFAAIAVEPVIGRPNELALFVVGTDERPAGRQKLGVDRDAAVNIIEAAKGFVAHTVEQGVSWLEQAWQDERSRAPTVI